MKKIYEDIKNVFESKVAFRILAGVGIVLVSLLIFSAGITIGFHKASFGRAWGDNYERNFPNANGAVGKIIKIQLPTIIVQDKDNTEKVILIKDDTKIQKMMSVIKASDLVVDNFVVIIGSPNNQGQIEAKLIRIMPAGLPVPPPFRRTPLPIQ